MPTDTLAHPTSTTNRDDSGFELDVVVSNISTAIEGLGGTPGQARLGAATSVGASSLTTRLPIAAIRPSRVIIDPWTTDAEIRPISSISTNTVNLGGSTLAYAHAADDPVLFIPRDVYNVELWGAKGDGTTDSTTALQRCFAAAAADNAAVYIPPGTFITNSPLNWTGRVPVFGAGYSSVLEAGASFSGSALLLHNAASIATQPYIGYLRLECESECGGVETQYGTEQGIFEHLTINGYNTFGIFLKSNEALANTTQQEPIIRHCIVESDGSVGTFGIKIGAGQSDAWCFQNLAKTHEDTGFWAAGGNSTWIQCHSYIGSNNNSGGRNWNKTAFRAEGSETCIIGCQLNAEIWTVELRGSNRLVMQNNNINGGIQTTPVESAVFYVSENSSNIRLIGNDIFRAGRHATGTVPKLVSGATGKTISKYRIEDNVCQPVAEFSSVLQSKVEATATYPGGSVSSFTAVLDLLGSTSDSRFWLSANANLGALWWSYAPSTRTLTINVPNPQSGAATVSIEAKSGRSNTHTF
jgi:hypothetical protein